MEITKDEVSIPALGPPKTEGPTTRVKGSDGLALSGIYTLGYNFNVKSGVKLLVGRPFYSTPQESDGLSREGVVSFTYSYRF